MQKNKKYSVVVCSYNRFELLCETVDSIHKQRADRDDIEIILVDNNSTDQTRSLHNRVDLYVLEVNQGLSHARNRGVKESRGSYVIHLDDDIELCEKYFEILDTYLSDNRFIIGGPVLPYMQKIPDWLPNKYHFLASVYYCGSKRKSVSQLLGANHIVPRNVHSIVGLYDTNLGRKGEVLAGGEESDYLIRAKAMGFEIYYIPELVVYHKIANKLNLDYITKYAYEYGKSRSYMLRKNSLSKYIIVYLLSVYGLLWTTLVKTNIVENAVARGFLKLKHDSPVLKYSLK